MENFNERPSPSSPHEEAEPHLEAGEGLGGTACSALLFRLFAADFILRLAEKYPGSSYETWKNRDGETVFSVGVRLNGRDQDGVIHSSPCLCVLIEGICERRASILPTLYPESLNTCPLELRVVSDYVPKRAFRDLSALVSRWIHLKGIPIQTSETTCVAPHGNPLAGLAQSPCV